MEASLADRIVYPSGVINYPFTQNRQGHHLIECENQSGTLDTEPFQDYFEVI
jgi:hypothetical protein